MISFTQFLWFNWLKRKDFCACKVVIIDLIKKEPWIQVTVNCTLENMLKNVEGSLETRVPLESRLCPWTPQQLIASQSVYYRAMEGRKWVLLRFLLLQWWCLLSSLLSIAHGWVIIRAKTSSFRFLDCDISSSFISTHFDVSTMLATKD
jgi:hypothetical protein